ncbi:MAG: helix-turn-helix transcriptional regulator [Veillonella sp.]|uniref:helix-turn-helix domain-containing protein n=1 Tax=Veillonella sp. TaxID=1926307 RepID=UPI0025E15B71|nr:helix-turn-helix transcriptional regulator [Veillonella sp.]MBS4914059.1 helix-turn-helix transcriptional regulator [Veillonella sp.]
MSESKYRTQIAMERSESSRLEKIGARIKELRKKKKYSQSELMRLVGINTHSTISKLENGTIGLSIDSVIKYADALGTTPEYLLFGITNGLTLKHMDEQTKTFVSNPDNYNYIRNLMLDLEIKKLQAMKK